jgi:guanine deaminase
MSDNRKFLRRAIITGIKGIEKGGGPFGAVIVRDNKIIAESNNRVVINTDPTAHAEILAIRKAAKLLGTHDLSSCIIYSSCEPCPMCLGAIYWAGINKVVYASGRKDASLAGFSDEHIYNEISLDPTMRKVNFICLDDPEARTLFDKWKNFEEKVKY